MCKGVIRCRYEACSNNFIGVAGQDIYCSAACRRMAGAKLRRIRARKHNNVSNYFKQKLLSLEAHARECSDRAQLALVTGNYSQAKACYQQAAKSMQDLLDMKARAVLLKQKKQTTRE